MRFAYALSIFVVFTFCVSLLSEPLCVLAGLLVWLGRKRAKE